jgi:hypothetical protein
VGVCLLWLCAAPTAGDIGSCGQDAEDLDPIKFFARKGGIDLAKCDECAFASSICGDRRDGRLEATEFAEGCFPLVHDGEVCLRALEDADCDQYRAYVRDDGPTVPTECNFCPARDAGVPADGP